MKIVVVGPGIIGSIYGGLLARSVHDVTLVARELRLAELRAQGLVLEDVDSGQRTEISLPLLDELSPDDRYDLVLVPVRTEQFASTFPMINGMGEGSDVLMSGNTTGIQTEPVTALGERALFGFPAAGGVQDGPIVRYVYIHQQRTMLGEADGTSTIRIHSANIGGWMICHSAFVVPIGFALYRFDTNAAATERWKALVACSYGLPGTGRLEHGGDGPAGSPTRNPGEQPWGDGVGGLRLLEPTPTQGKKPL